jgi:hypothetical protein
MRSYDNPARQIGGRFIMSIRKVPLGAMLEQHHILRFLLKEGNEPFNIFFSRG